MSEQDLSSATNTPSTESDSSPDNAAAHDNHVLAKVILEIQQTPEEYLPNLLQIVRLFRESVTMNPVRSDAYEKAMDEIKNPDPVKKSVQQIALSELLRSWREEGDEQEQQETWEILEKALDEGGVSIAYAKAIAFSKLPKEERIKRNQAAIELLNSWVEEGDEQEQKETWEILKKSLDESGVSI